MVLNDAGLNRVRDLINSDLYEVQAGSGSTVPTVSDTALESAIAGTLNSASSVTSDKQISITNVITSVQGSGSTISEANCTLNSGATQLFRSTYNGLTKAGNEEHSHITRVFFRNNG